MNPKQYQPSRTLQKLWKIELDLLKKFIRVCQTNNLNYFIIGGTLLGAARHKGFIPWDNDIDIMMPRKDYDRLWEIAPKEFNEPYFFQTSLTEKKDRFFRPHAQLRNSQTIGYARCDEEKNINKGVFIDIFPLDKIPDSHHELKVWLNTIQKQKKLMERYCKKKKKFREYFRLSNIISSTLFSIISYKRFFSNFNRNVLGKYKNAQTQYVANVSLGWIPSLVWPEKYFSDYCFLEFEGIKVKAPCMYKEVLDISYGDWHKYPDDVSEGVGTMHGEIIFDENFT